MAIYFSSDHSNAEQCVELIDGQLRKLRTAPLTARQLSMAKKQFIAQLAISSESNESYMLGAGKACWSTTAWTPWSRSTPRSAI